MLEFSRPAAMARASTGTVRLGYFRPSGGIAIGELPFLATLALAVFLLTPIFYLLVRHEIRPMRTIMADMEKASAGGDRRRRRRAAERDARCDR